jgi:putative transposase
VQRGNNRQAVFFDEADYRAYLKWLNEGAERYGFSVHAYVCMTNHAHVLGTPKLEDSVSRMIQFVGRYYVSYVNHQYGRTGTLWEGRHKGALIDSDEYLLACQRYIELNPVRAGMVETPGEYPWSSYRANAFGEKDSLLTHHLLYRRLGADPAARQAAYRELFRTSLAPEQVHGIRAAWQTGTPLGNDRFREQIEAAVNKKVGYARRGRPRKKQDDD